ncbi:ankyrin [Aaosphaeria arxii CBS 175.79]|uniref:Ankyrin n=1 Tax=Aaosphaeria arxii CBS 175.79 TaxID=1450172 RepID=A0A6A5XKC8_9PLEO|nr:ankyrin [Aaosphaeria arxii CBS 175.79]KAF2013582.1 ankyrin [Aaosphaeria arxii CBS 175.79]
MTLIDLSTIPSSASSPDWDVPKVTVGRGKHLVTRTSTSTTTVIGRALKELGLEFKTFLASSPSLQELHKFIRPWILPGSNQVQPMVLEWMSYFGSPVIAAKLERFDLVAALLDCGFQFGPGIVTHAVEIAVKTNSPATLEFVLDRGWDINQSIRFDSVPILGQVVDNRALVEWCLSRGADPNGTCARGYTIMQRAASKATLATVKRLIAVGGDISPTSQSAGVVAHAVEGHSEDKNRIPIIEYLLSVGADINAVYLIQEKHDQFCLDYLAMDKTALHVAIHRGDRTLIEYLLVRGADATAKTRNRFTNMRWMDVVEFAEHREHTDLVGLLREVKESVET